MEKDHEHFGASGITDRRAGCSGWRQRRLSWPPSRHQHQCVAVGLDHAIRFAVGACRRHWAPTALTIRLGRSVLLGTPAHHQRHVRLMEKMMSKTNDKTRRPNSPLYRELIRLKLR